MMTRYDDILTLKRAYGAMRLVSALPQPSSNIQTELVSDILLSPHFRDYPPSRDFRKSFWKWIVENLESQGEEVDERIYKAYLDLLSQVSTSSSSVSWPPPPSYATHFWFPSSINLQDTSRPRLTTLLESRTLIEDGTTGLSTWGASLTLADWLVAHPDVVQGRRVLELGSGAGFLGLIIAALQLDAYGEGTQRGYGAHNTPGLVLTDVNPEVLSRCRQNFALPCNRLDSHPCLDFRLLDWRNALDGEGNIDIYSALVQFLKDIDVIVGADLVYDSALTPALVAVLALFFIVKRGQKPAPRNLSSQIYIGLTVRREDTISEFLNCLSRNFLKCEEIRVDTNPPTQFLRRSDAGVQDNVKILSLIG